MKYYGRIYQPLSAQLNFLMKLKKSFTELQDNLQIEDFIVNEFFDDIAPEADPGWSVDLQ